ncbi:hypothetical protein V3C99_018038 [Haemonchus contortus]|uniref:PIGA domain-containing protein n=1 Tax=Haemonchus contortus TaxID=6289 RepID=A0A7I4Z4M8_HAECO
MWLTLFRALGKPHGCRVTMEDVPREFAFLPDGSQLLQYATSQTQICYSAGVIEKACRLGLCALVANGIHDLQPDAINANGQLYVIHGVMANSVDIPLLFAITTRDIWNKWDVQELRTTNVAESFNRSLGVVLQVKYPRMSDLLRALQGCVTTARGAFLNIEREDRTESFEKEGPAEDTSRGTGDGEVQGRPQQEQGFPPNVNHNNILQEDVAIRD